MSRKNVLKRGFTLIELLVVIAIIGILSSIVLAQLGTARSSGQSGAQKSQLSSMRAQAELYFNRVGNYGPVSTTAGSCTVLGAASAQTLFTDTAANGGLAALRGGQLTGATMTCNSTTAAWAVAATLQDGSHFCVDSAGSAKSTQGSTATAYTALTGAATAALTSTADVDCN